MATSQINAVPSAHVEAAPVTVDRDIRTHMLATYASLRRLIAVATAAFLITLAGYRYVGHDPVHRDSISAYYYHHNGDVRMKDLFIAALSSVGLLLVAYQGYTDRENWALNTGGVALLGVVAFPMDWDLATDSSGELTIRGGVHYTCAVTFFLSLGYVCLYRAQDTLGLIPVQAQRTYRNLYRITGFFMWTVPAVALLLRWIGYDGWVYVVEYFGVSVFLIYWIVKSVEMRVSLTETPQGLAEAEARAQ
ncbi:hypothetical protein [Frigoriglobus tundricola]|uniref:DUF998 domain-containing protein n=1 Tax=Frigoriglobus tundricola TaxID=2774151 RepID=A0A6M5YKJ6_9BACT|nr:hypothetical protein [Frigoriglobus tundricola]QJW94547.1 hypothetical protein FTUN_2068 [Frigoriglobus tundricola]